MAATRLHCPWDSPGKNTGVGCHFLLQCMKVKSESEVAQSCPTLSDPMDCSLAGSSVHGIFQAKYWSGVPLPSPSPVCSSPYNKGLGFFWGKTWRKNKKCLVHTGILPQEDLASFYSRDSGSASWLKPGTDWFCFYDSYWCFALLTLNFLAFIG